MANAKSLNRLQSFFQLGFKPNAQLDNDKVFPLKTNRVSLDNKSDVLKFTKQKFSDETEKLFTHWLSNDYIPQKSFTNRLALYDDMDVLYFNCLGANEKIITKEKGLVSISSIAGEELTLLTSKGWVLSRIEHFGKDYVYDVHFNRRGLRKDRIVKATLNHRWRLNDGSFIETNKLVKPHTEGYDYIPASKIPYVSAKREIDVNSIDYIFGVRHGLIYGDGTTIKKCERNLGYSIRICCDKDDLLPFFEGYNVTYPPSFGGDPVVFMWDAFSKTHPLKELPSDNETDEYLTGFFRGWLAADGSVLQDGQVSITSGRDEIEWLKTHMPRVGIQFGNVKNLEKKYGLYIRGKEVIPQKDMAVIRINRVTLTKDDFIIKRKQDRFLEVETPEWSFSYIDYESRSYEDVYCAIVPEVHDFVLEDGLLTGNCSYIARAIELVADETIQADTNDQPIFIDAKRPVKKYIQKFFDDININALLRPTLVDIIQYGNAGWILGFDDKGINEIIPVNVRSLKDRLEFSPYEVKQEIQKQSALFSAFNKMSRMSSLIDSIMDKEETTSYFKKYLFGFQVEDKVLPPWKFIHFRNLTNKSPFAPFGIPLYIHSMSAYKQYDAAMTLQNAARVARFPKQVVSINLPNQMDATTKIEKAMEAMQEWLNIGFGTSKKELPGLGDVIFTIKDLFEFQDVKVDVDLGDIGDIEILRDAIIVSTMLPRYIIDPKDSGFGDTGVALIEKWKPFARLIYRMQSILLENITQLVKIQMLYTGDFSLEDTKFTLSMKYPESQVNADIVSSQSSLLDLANNIISAIQDKVTGGEQLPPELLKSIYTQFLPYDTAKIEAWIDDAIKAKDNEETIPTADSLSNEQQIDELQNPPEENTEINAENGEEPVELSDDTEDGSLVESLRARRMWKLLEKQKGAKVLKEQVDNIIFEEKHEAIRESVMQGRHVFSSKVKDISFPAEKLREWDKEKVKKFSENSLSKEDRLINEKEEIKYVFTYASQDEKIKERLTEETTKKKRSKKEK